MSDQLEEAVKDFVAKHAGAGAEMLQLQTTLFGDLGVDGDDGPRLIEAFAKEFDVDISGFNPSDHFGPEAGPFPLCFVIQLFRRLVLNEDAHLVGGVKPITIYEMIEAARSRTLRS